MDCLQAYAYGPDVTDTNLRVVLVCVGIFAAAAVLALIPPVISWARRLGRSDGLVAAALIWGVLAAGSAAFTVISQMNWSRERQMRIESGYYNFDDDQRAPTAPVRTWGLLAVAYVGLVVWASARKRRLLPSSGTPEEDRGGGQTNAE